MKKQNCDAVGTTTRPNKGGGKGRRQRKDNKKSEENLYEKGRTKEL